MYAKGTTSVTMTTIPTLLWRPVLLIALLTDSVVPFTISNRQMVVSMHTYAKSWNEAEEICRISNGNLYTTDSEERQVVLAKYFDENTQSNTKKHFWIGLHSPAILTTGTYGWASCLIIDSNQYDSWSSNTEPASPSNNKCIYADKNDQTWKSGLCNENHIFMCLTELTASCTFTQHNGKMPADMAQFSNTASVVADASECTNSCLNATLDDVNCWAVNYDNSNNECTLLFTVDPFYLTTSTMTSSSKDVYVKDCYSGDSITSEDTGLSTTATASTEPTQACSTYSLPTTTTTTVATTTTPTTTTAGTTSSTTTVGTTTTSSVGVTTTSTAGLTTATTTNTGSTVTGSTTATTTNTGSTVTGSTTATTTNTGSTVTGSTTATTTNTGSTVTGSTTATTTNTGSTVTGSTTATTTNTGSTVTGTTTDTLTPTTIASVSTTSDDKCWCSCDILTNVVSQDNLTLEEKVQEIQQKLHIDTSKLSNTIRQKTSAPDSRTAAVSVGAVSIGFMSAMIGLIIAMDTGRFFRFIKHLCKRRKVDAS